LREEYEIQIPRFLEALRGDKTIQEIASKHKVYPNQVGTWKCQAMDGLGAVFSNGADRAG